MPRLTQKVVTSAKAGEKEQTFWDDKVRGFGLRVRPSGRKAYIFVYRPRGRTKLRKITIGPAEGISLDRAREEATRLWQEVILGNDPARATSLGKENTVETAFEDYKALRLSEVSEKRKRMLENLFKRRIFPELGDKPVGEVTRSDIRRITDILYGKRIFYAANQCHEEMSAFLSWCADRQLIEFNPLRGARPPAPKRPRKRVLSKEELVTIWRATEKVEEHWRTCIRLLIVTGQRRGEVMGARWEEFNFKDRLWNLPADRAKNNEEHTLPLSPLAMDLLHSIPKSSFGTCVFPSPIRRKGRPLMQEFAMYGMGNVVTRLRPMVKIPDWRIHDLRRSVATHMAALGVLPHVVEAVLNHKSRIMSRVAAVYNRHRFIPEMRAALELWSSTLTTWLETIPSLPAPNDPCDESEEVCL